MRMYRLTALLLCALCSGLMLTGCGGSAKKNQNITEDEMPYGSTMREDKTSFAVPITYDRRFVDEEMAGAAANYFAAIQNQDAALYQASTFDFYLTYQQDKVYSVGSADEVIGKLHESVAKNTGEDFQFNMVLLNDVATNMEAGDLGEICKMLNTLYTGDGSFTDSVEDAWDFTVELNIGYEDNRKFVTNDEQHLFLFKTQNGYFCVI